MLHAATNLIRKLWKIRKINLEVHTTLTFLKYEILLPCSAAKMSPIFGIKTSLVQIRSLRTSIKQLLVVRRATWQFGDSTKKCPDSLIHPEYIQTKKTNKQTNTHIHTYTDTYTYIYTHTYIHLCIYVLFVIYIYIYIYIYI